MFDSLGALRRDVLTAITPKAQVWDCGAGRVRVRNAGHRLYIAEYSGAMGEHCFAALRGHVVAATSGASALVLDMSKVLDLQLQPPPIPDGVYLAHAAPGVVICRADHHAMWSAYAANMAEIGVMRVVFHDSERTLALTVARALASH